MLNDFLLLKDKCVLYAEDDNITRTQMTTVLEMIFGRVLSAKDGAEAYEMYEDEKPDILITDIKMPRVDGIKLVKQIRQNDYQIPIVMMTSFAEQDLLMSAANLSVDGYLIKPAELGVVLDTIRKSIYRANKNVGLIDFGNTVVYNTATRELFQNGVLVPLGQKEQELLLLLVKNNTRVVTKDEIAQELWPLDTICASAIKSLILRMRRKIGFDIIVSVRGIGYRLNIGNQPSAPSHEN